MIGFDISPDSHLNDSIRRVTVTVGAVLDAYDSNNNDIRKAELARKCGEERIRLGVASQEDVFLYGNADQVKLMHKCGLRALNEAMKSRVIKEF